MRGAQVAVAVVSWNTRELLRACLGSVRPDAERGVARVCVVDNGSTDGSPEMVAEEFPWVELTVAGENLGFGRAVNLVAERGTEPWIAPANADIQLAPGALASLLAAGDVDPLAGAIAPRLIGPDGETQHSIHPFPGLRLGLAVNLGLARVTPRLGDRLCLEGSWNAERGRRVDWAHGAFLLVRRPAYDEVGGFDPRQWMYAEDIDLCWRLRRAGWHTRYEPRARVRHEISAATTEAFAEERHDRHIAAAYTWMARRRGIGVAWLYAGLNLAGAAVRWAVCAPLALVAPARCGPRRRRYRRYLRLHRLGLRSRRALLEADRR